MSFRPKFVEYICDYRAAPQESKQTKKVWGKKKRKKKKVLFSQTGKTMVNMSGTLAFGKRRKCGQVPPWKIPTNVNRPSYL